MTIRNRLLLLVALATLLPAVLIGLRFAQDRTENIAAATRSLETAANTIAYTLAEKIQGTTQLHYGLARASVLDTVDKAACSAFLSTVLDAYPQYTGILTIQPDGQLFCDSLRTGRVLDLRDRQYFKEALTATEGVVTEPVFGRLTGLSVLQIAYPARADSGAIKFVLLASLNLGDLVQRYRSELPRMFDIVLLDAKGTVLVGSPSDRWQDRVGSSIGDAELFRFSETHPAGGVGEVTGLDGSSQVWAIAENQVASAAGVRVLVGTGSDDLLKAANERFIHEFAILVGAAFLLFAGVWLLAELGIRKQIGRIALMAERLGQGDLAERIPPPYPSGEFGRLVTTLNGAAESLARQRNDIEDLNERLRQAHKMEAIGQLTGGISHDFNNLLGVVIGNLDLAVDQLASDPDTRELVQDALDGATRGATLVKQLLAFSRQQPLEPQVIDLNERLPDITALLRQSLGEDITINTLPGEDLRLVLLDPTQLLSAILNLSINARDAMPAGGTLSIQTANRRFDADYAALNPDVAPGDYVMIAVSDTGAGMSPDVLARAFEPFFTTKQAGQGTGLGLAMVHGFVKQSGGHVTAYSEVGHGTTIRLYFPATSAGRADRADVSGSPGEAVGPPGGAETVLVVDDRADMRATAIAMLRRLGYQVLEADTAAMALEILKSGVAIDLVLSDIVMPGGMSGLDLVREMRALGIGLPVLLSSGYASQHFMKAHAGNVELPMIAKPYRIAELAAKLRAALGGQA